MIRKISKSRRQRIIENIDLELGMIGLFLLLLILVLFLEKDTILLMKALLIPMFVLLILRLLLKKNLSDKFIPNFLK